MALTTTEVSKIYVALLGRASEGAGSEYWQNSKSISSVVKSILSSSEFINDFDGTLNDNRIFIEHVYKNAFNKLPSDDEDGINYWVNSLNSGVSKENVIKMIITASQLSENSGDGQNVFNNKVLVSNYVAENIKDANIDNLENFKDYIDNITSDSSSVQDAYTLANVDILALGKIPINPNTTTGIVSDGYVSNSTVFADTNDNGILDNNEKSTITDVKGEFTLENALGNLIAVRGTDISTGLTFDGIFTAPEGSNIVSPLTTLVNQVMNISDENLSYKEASKYVEKALGINENIDLLTFDPIAVISDDSTPQELKDTALAIQTAAVEVVNMMNLSAAVLNGAGIADEIQGTLASAQALAEMILDDVTTPTIANISQNIIPQAIDFTSTNIIETFLKTAAQKAGASENQFANVDAVVQDVAIATVNINTVMTDNTQYITQNVDYTALLTELAKTQVAAEEIKILTKTAAQNGDVTAVANAADTTAIEIAAENAADEVEAAQAQADAGDVITHQENPTPVVVYINHSPTVKNSLTSNTIEGSKPYTINLLQGAKDIDGDTLKVYGFNELNNDAGWSLDGNTLTINPNFYELNADETQTLQFNYVIQDNYGAGVAQTLDINIQGTDAPTLDITKDIAESANKIAFTILATPDIDENIGISFDNLPEGAVILDFRGNNVTNTTVNYPNIHSASMIDTNGQTFTLILDKNQNVNQNMSIVATGYDDSNNAIADTSKDFNIVYAVNSSSQNLNFNSTGQSMWDTEASQPISFHKYIPLIGDVAEVWDEETQEWTFVDNAAWSSGDMSLVDVTIDPQIITDEIKRDADSLLDSAKVTFENNSRKIDADVQQAFDDAKQTFNDALKNVDTNVQQAFDDAKENYEKAKDIFDTAKQTFNSAADTFFGWQTDALNSLKDAKNGAYSSYIAAENAWKATEKNYDNPFGTITTHDPIKEADMDAKWLVYEGAKAAYNTGLAVYNDEKDIYNDAADTFDNAKHAFEVTATDIYNAAKSTYETAIQAANDVALATFQAAEDTYDTAKQAVYDAAKTVLDGVQSAYDNTMDLIGSTEFQAYLQLNAKLDALVGFEVNFGLDMGSVDTNLDYTLSTETQYNKTTDTLTLTPTMTNANGDSIAYSTMSPNAYMTIKLVSDVDATIDTNADATLTVGGNKIIDISGDADGLSSSTTLTTNFSNDDVSKLTLFTYDSTDAEPFEVPYIAEATQGIVDVELSIPNIATDSKVADYNRDYFNEGGLVNISFDEIANDLVNLVQADIKYSDQLKEAYGGDLPELSSGTIGASISTILRDYILDLSDGKTDKMPIFVIDNTDQNDSSFLHINSVSDEKTLDTLTDNTAKYGFFVSYGESENPVAKVTVDIDQLAAVILNDTTKAAATTVTLGAAAATLATPVFNPMDISFDLADFFNKDDKTTATGNTDEDADIPAYAKPFDISGSFETADVKVNENANFSQKFSLSVDDMSYLIKLEDGTIMKFNANDSQDITINDLSFYDTNGDGKVAYTFDIIPTAMFSNDTELKLGFGYNLKFLDGNLSAGLNIPISDFFGGNFIPAVNDIDTSFIDVNFGPLLSIEGDLDALDIDVFENRFNIDVGSATTEVQTIGISDDTMFST